MIEFFLSTEAGRWLASISAIVVSFIAVAVTQRRAGAAAEKNEQKVKALEHAAKQEKRGRDEIASEKRATVDANSRDLVDRLRRRDGDWDGL